MSTPCKGVVERYSLVKVNDIQIEVQPDVKHDWLLSTKDVAEGYGLSDSGIQKYKDRYADELVEGKHFVVTKTERLSGKKTFWTKRGVVRLGFFIKTPMAKEFRDWAEDYIINERAPKPYMGVDWALPKTYLEALEELISREREVLVENGIEWFVAKDVAEVLGYKKARNAITTHVDEEDALKRGTLTNGGTQELTYINESGLYALILNSKLPSAKAFKKWVTSEVLPTIRKHGAYMTSDVLAQAHRHQ